jgi:hypothetical protein
MCGILQSAVGSGSGARMGWLIVSVWAPETVLESSVVSDKGRRFTSGTWTSTRGKGAGTRIASGGKEGNSAATIAL